MRVDTRPIRACIGLVISFFASTIAVAIWFYFLLPPRACPVFQHSPFGTPSPLPLCHYYDGVPYRSFWDCLDAAPSWVTYFIGGAIGIGAGAISGKLC